VDKACAKAVPGLAYMRVKQPPDLTVANKKSIHEDGSFNFEQSENRLAGTPFIQPFLACRMAQELPHLFPAEGIRVLACDLRGEPGVLKPTVQGERDERERKIFFVRGGQKPLQLLENLLVDHLLQKLGQVWSGLKQGALFFPDLEQFLFHEAVEVAFLVFPVQTDAEVGTGFSDPGGIDG
jgi:hypothetical protein